MPPLFLPPTWSFVPADLDAGSLQALQPWFDQLAARPLDTAADAAAWLRDESELQAMIGATQARRYVRMTRNTADAEAKAAYLELEQQVMPQVKVLSNALDRRFLESPGAALLPPDYEVLMRRRRTHTELFRAANTDLQHQEAELQMRQQALMGGIKVELDGKVLTLQQVAPWLELQDRATRERAWRAALQARQAHWPELEGLYDQLVALRTQMARNADHQVYTSYRFLELGRYDYDQTTCRQLHDAIADCVVPAVRELDRRRAKALGLPRLRPWDLEVDPEGLPPLRPFQDQSELIGLCQKLLGAVDPTFATALGELDRLGLLDLMSRPGKAPGGYQYQLEDERLPFVFANSVGLHHDVQTLLHESGHAVHSLLCRHFDLLAYRDYPIEVAETASMSMELLGLEHLTTVYQPQDARRIYRKHLEGILRTLTWIASIDAFQHWVYDRPRHTGEERRVAWLDLRRRFGGEVDWQGLDDALAMQWIAQTHLFNHPLYYIEYGIAQLAALQVWRRYRAQPAAAVAGYQRALGLGGSRPVPELFAAMNVRFDLSPAMLRELVGDVMTGIDGAR